MNISDIPDFLYKKLSFEWYASIKKEFEHNDLYDKTEKRLQHSITDLVANSNDEAVELKRDIGIDLLQYCWNNYIFLSGYTKYLIEKNEKSYCGIDIFKKIIEVINSNIKGYSPHDLSIIISDLCNKIIGIKDKLQRELTGDIGDNEEYLNIIQYVLKLGNDLIFHEFSLVLEIYNFISNEGKKIAFTLNKNQLAAFLIILQESGIISDKNSDESIQIFAREYFLYKDQETGDFKQSKKFNKDFSDLKNGNSGTGVDYLDRLKIEISKMLSAGLPNPIT